MRYKIIATLAMLIAMCTFLGACSMDQNAHVQQPSFRNNERQVIEKSFDGGLIKMVVELNNSSYAYHDYIYVTATLINKSNEPVELVVSNKSYALTTVIAQGENHLIDVDLYWKPTIKSESIVVLEPGEKYIQNMRFSTREFNEYSAEKVLIEEKLPSGMYEGEICAQIISEMGEKDFKVKFSIEIAPEVVPSN